MVVSRFAAEMTDHQQASLPLLEGGSADSFVLELPVEGGRTLVCTVRQHPEHAVDDSEIVQVVLSFREPFFGQHEAGRELFLHW